ncbi:glycosyltransferase family 2 protein [Chryseobacterium sp. Y16C]|uniref:glycosyltransferase family 2 protein n=1 Tax=Chryseobacterium sp. Y16C TaxID=2920939 RepID=UPI001F0A8192|nr:glycosyltransferase family A protein [Chryseobacterium sp. Y16C]UMQ40263.1 glycosyltransferase family 2 protein [Chryseobacterium sp. Y16C]
MFTIRVSIIVPCYNQAQYLDECLRSILEQSYQDWECIIIDDGSPDNTEETAKKWIEKDARFKYLKKENEGVSSARNFGIERAQGEWILPLDGDDKIGTEYLSRAAKYFENNFTIIYCKANLFGTENGPWNLRKYSYSEMLWINHIFCSAFFRKQSWLDVGGYDTSFVLGMEDWDFWLSILQPDSKVLQLDYTGFYYRRKKISRDTEFLKSADNQLVTEKNIYTKHLDKYLLFDKNPITNFTIQQKKITKLQRLEGEISKNIFTRFLYKLIEKL